MTLPSSARTLFTKTGAALCAWSALIGLTHVWGTQLIESGREIKIFAPPLSGHFDARITWRLMPALALAAATVWFGPRIAQHLPWRVLLGATAALAASWSVVLALVDGADALTIPLARNTDYLSLVGDIRSVPSFVADFTQRLPTYPVHVQGHPPGMVVLLTWLAAAGFEGPQWAAPTVIAAGAMCVPAALLAIRDVAGTPTARVAAPFLAAAPAAIWMATSADALFAGVSAWAIALFILATGRRDKWCEALSLGSGFLFGFALLLTYGAAALVLVGAAVCLRRRRWRPIAPTTATAAAVLAAAAGAGFGWWEGLAATEATYRAGVSSARPYEFFIVNNLAAFGLAVGPAALAGATLVPRSRMAWLVGGALMAVVVADLSGLSKGEVERIWLLFVPWIVAATGLLRNHVRLWLLLHTTVALAIAAFVRTPW
jgi:methylthioxylose transferase